jgi:hypothetical protein
MLARGLDGAGKKKDIPPRRAVERSNLDEFHPPRRHGARLVEDHGPDAARLFEDFGSLDQDAELRSAARSDHERRRWPDRARKDRR